MGNSRDHIIYNHPPNRDGFRCFYISYRPGRQSLELKYRRADGELEIIPMSALEMVEYLTDKRDYPTEEWPFEVADPALRVLKGQLQRWHERRLRNAGL
jgi:hypothetical protein